MAFLALLFPAATRAPVLLHMIQRQRIQVVEFRKLTEVR